ncbi:FecR family protein [Zhouia sp. PK063]|uniref:FecR family protein n=1 Tax=Zhouia sp. PK063 TaxID=3373602 RepID=UPI003797A72A
MNTNHSIKYLLKRFHENTITREEYNELVHYIQDANYKEEILSQMDAVTTNTIHTETNLAFAHIQKKIQYKQSKKKYRKTCFGAIAALLLVAITSAVYFTLYQPSQTIQYLHSKALAGERKLVMLPDGTKVYLNANSEITYPEHFSKHHRIVMLKGEAFFDVVHESQRLFLVKTKNITTQVLGTSFNIQSYNNVAIKVSVATGKVVVKGEMPDKTQQKVVLLPNEQASLENNKLLKKQVNTATLIAWKNNILLFDKTTVAQAVTVLERWYKVTITYPESIKNKRISGDFKPGEQLPEVLKTLSYVLDINCEFKNNTTILLTLKNQNK